jgi:acyl carrier protein
VTEAEIYAEMTTIFHDVFSREDIVLRPDLTAADVEGWDSFRMIEIVMAAEEKFKIKFHTKDLDSLNNVGDLVRVVREKTN